MAFGGFSNITESASALAVILKGRSGATRFRRPLLEKT